MSLSEQEEQRRKSREEIIDLGKDPTHPIHLR